MRDLSFYNELLQNEDRRYRNQLDVIDSKLDAVKPWTDLSQKAAKLAFKLDEKRSKKQKAKGSIQANLDGIDKEKLNNYYKTKQNLHQADININNEIVKLDNQGVSANMISKMKDYSKDMSFGYAEQMATLAADHYPTWLEAQLAENDQLEVEVNGRKFKVNEAQTEAELTASLSALKEVYFDISGLSEFNELIVHDKAWDKLNKAENTLIKAKQKDDRVQRGVVDTINATEKFKSDGDFVALVASLSATWDDKGNLNRFAGGKKEALEVFKDLATDPTMSYERLHIIINGDPEAEPPIKGIKDQVPGHMGGKSYGEFDEGFIAELNLINERARNQRTKDELANEKAQEDTLAQNFRQAVIDKGEEYFTEEELQWWNDEYTKLTGKSGPPQYTQTYVSVEDADIVELEKDLKETRARRKYLLMSDLAGLPTSLVNKYLTQVREDKTLAQAAVKGASQDADNMVKSYIATAVGLAVGDDGKSSPEFNRIYLRAKPDFERVYMNQIVAGESEANALNNALVHVRDTLGLSATGEKTGKFKLNNSPYAEPFKKTDISSQVYQVNMGREQINADPRVIDTQVLAGSEEHLEVLKNNLEKGITTIPRYYKVVSDSYPELSDWELADKQLKASGHPGLEPNPIAEELDNLPELKRYFYYRSTPKRVQQNIGKTEDINNPQEISYFNRNQDVLLPGLSIA